jgi:NTE family protein
MPEGITLVLGGVGVRGVANIGVLQVLREQNVPIRRIVTTGLSALIAAHFSLGGDLDGLQEDLVAFFTANHRYLWGMERYSGLSREELRRAAGSLSYFLRQRLFCQLNLKRMSVLPWTLVDGPLSGLFGEATNADLRVPVSVSVIDLEARTHTLLSEGRVLDLVKAGISFPGLLPPVERDGRRLTSSILYCDPPMESLEESDRPIVAVDLYSAAETVSPHSLLEILTRADELRSRVVKERLLQRADRVIALESLRHAPWGGYQRLSEWVSRARDEMRQHIDSIPH